MKHLPRPFTATHWFGKDQEAATSSAKKKEQAAIEEAGIIGSITT